MGLSRARPGLLTPLELMDLPRQGVQPVVVDLRKDRGDEAPRVPGSVWADLHGGFAMSRPERNLAYDLPSGGEVAAALGGLGITPDSTVVFLDDMLNRWATRAYWVLRYYGHRGDVFVLDGGVAAYAASDAPHAREFFSPAAVPYPIPKEGDESIRITAADVVSGIEDGSLLMCDVRSPAEYTGEMAMSGRGGRIPGAVHVPFDQCLRPDGTFLPDNRLASVLAPFLDDTKMQVPYCQGGIRASLTWFALHVLLGRPAKLYAASWEEWAQDPTLPVELAE